MSSKYEHVQNETFCNILFYKLYPYASLCYKITWEFKKQSRSAKSTHLCVACVSLSTSLWLLLNSHVHWLHLLYITTFAMIWA